MYSVRCFWQASNATGKLSVVPVCNFDQSDLCADDVMLLDTFTNVFVWVGAAANETERAQVPFAPLASLMQI